MPANAIMDEGIIVFELTEITPNIKVEIKGADYTSDVEFASIEANGRGALSSFALTMNNYKGRYNSGVSEGDAVVIYLDNTDANAIQLRGKIDKKIPSLRGSYSITLTGRNRPELEDNTDLNIEFNADNVADAFRAVIDDLNNKLGYTVISYNSSSFPSSSITISRIFRDISYLEALNFIAQLAGWEYNIGNDIDGLIEAVNRGDNNKKSSDIISIGVNFISTAGIGKDYTRVRNRITVYGGNNEGVLTVWTVSASSFSPWRKTLIINDTSCTTPAQCRDRAQMEYNELSAARYNGIIECTGLINLKTGYSIDIYIPYVFIGTAVIKSYSHFYSMDGWMTNVSIDQITDIDQDLIKKNSDRIKDQRDLNNPNAMIYSELFLFNNDNQTESSSNVTIENGKLKLNTTVDQGEWISKPVALPENVSSMEIRFNGNDDCDLFIFEVSADSGDNYSTVTAGTKGNPGTIKAVTAGKNIKARVTLKSNTDNPRPEIESLVLLGKT